MSEDQMLVGREPEHTAARLVLTQRYKWELEAITQDIINKLEMEIINTAGISSYLSNLLKSHPRTRSVSLACETLSVALQHDAATDVAVELVEEWEGDDLCGRAYYRMSQDVFNELAGRGIRIP